MLEKISVRKPLTVLVGVILVTVLGVMSFINTSTDLLPEMDLPFSAVFVMYPGATPEQVERDISIPIEARMSTLGGIQTVQSISSEHVAIVILEFTGTTNMDSASLELREALDMMMLPEGASRPMTIRMNPEMLPIMTANVHMRDVDIEELSEFARYVVAPALEGVPGVAVVSLSGLVQNQLHVVLREEYFAEVAQQLERAGAGMMIQLMAELAPVVQVASADRLEELMEEGLSFEEAGLQVQEELPDIQAVVFQEAIGDFGGGEMNGGAMPGALSVEAVAGMLFAQNFAMPAGMFVEEGTEYMVRVGDRFETLEDVKNMLIFDPAAMGFVGMEPVRLSDVAHVFETNEALTFAQVNNDYAVMLSVQRQSEFSTADVATAVRNRMDELMAEHDGLDFAILMDQGEMINIIISSVLNNLIWGGLLAVVILLLFLRDIRPTLIVAVSIPISLLLAFTLMYFTGVSLNMISMGGLALAVGMLVDNSIVVIENIYRMRATTGRSAARAAVSGARQVSGAIVAASLTTISVFLPIIFTGGITRQIFTDLALTISFALLASLIIALTVVPACASTLFKDVKNQGLECRIFTRFIDGYESVLKLSLRFKWVIILIAVAGFVLSLWAVGRRGMELFPPMDSPQIMVTIEMPEGTTFEAARDLAVEFSSLVQEIKDVETVGVSVGGGGMMGMMAASLGFGDLGGGFVGTDITVYILMHDDRTISQEELNTQVRNIAYSLDPELEVSIEGDDAGMAMMTGAPISLRIEGRELDDIRDTAINLAYLVMRDVSGAINITDMTEQAAPELRVSVNKDVAMTQGLTVIQVFMAVNSALTAPEQSMNMTLSGRSYEIIISDGDFVEPGWESIENLQIALPAGGYVYLWEIAEVTDDIGFTSINRINRNRFVNITGEIAEGYTVGQVNSEIERILETFEPVGDTRVIVGGEAEAIADAFNDLLMMMALGLLFMYLIMVAQFQSLLSPFIIMLTIPLAFTGGFVGLLIVGMPLSIVAMIGLILLAGVSTNNGLVFISRINQMRWEGMAKKDAIIDAGRKRIRPILMMAISTIFAMSVIALGIGEGTEMMQPMAIVIIGGLVYATAMTLIFVPVLYDMMHRNKDVTKEDLDSVEE